MSTTPTDKSYFGYKVTTPEITLRDYFAAAALTGMYACYQGNAPEPEPVAWAIFRKGTRDKWCSLI